GRGEGAAEGAGGFAGAPPPRTGVPQIPPASPRDVTPGSDSRAMGGEPHGPMASRSGRTTATPADPRPTAPPAYATTRSGSTPPRWPTHGATAAGRPHAPP